LDRGSAPQGFNENGPVIVDVAPPATDKDNETYKTPNR
jgi:hypothetical protein